MSKEGSPQHPLIEPSMPGIPGIVKDGIFFSLVEANEETKKLTARYAQLLFTDLFYSQPVFVEQSFC